MVNRVPILDVRSPITITRLPITVVRFPIKGLRVPIVSNPNKLISPQSLDTEELIERFTPLIRSVYKLFCSYNGIFEQQADYEDLYQQVLCEFLRLCNEYDPTRGVDFPGYIKFHLQNRVYHFVTKEQKRRQREAPAKSFGWGDDEYTIDMENFPELIDMDSIKAIERVEALASLDWRAIKGKKHRELIEGILFKGKTLEEMAKEEGVTMKVMRLRLHFACTKLKEWHEEMEDYMRFRNNR